MSAGPVYGYNPFTGNLDQRTNNTGPNAPYPGGVTAWQFVIGTTQFMTINRGYIINNPALCTLYLPVNCGYGSYFRVVGHGIGGWLIQCNAGQSIHYGVKDSTVGGSLSSTAQYDSIEILCTGDNLDFTIIAGPQGNLITA